VVPGLHSRFTKRDIEPALPTILNQELHGLPQSSQAKFRKTLWLVRVLLLLHIYPRTVHYDVTAL